MTCSIVSGAQPRCRGARGRLNAQALAVPTRQGLKFQGFNRLETEFLAEEIFDDNCYLKPGVIDLKEGDTVVDVGSNIGIFGFQAAQIVGSTGRVLSIEALPPTFDKLQHNRAAALQQDHVSAEWTAVNAAAGASDGEIEMTFFPRAAGWGTSDPKHHRERMKADLNVFIRSLLQDKSSKISNTLLARFGRLLLNLSAKLFHFILGLYTSWMAAASTTYMVPCLTLTSIFQNHSIGTVSLLKVDVEGAEVSVRPSSTCGLPTSTTPRGPLHATAPHPAHLLCQCSQIRSLANTTLQLSIATVCACLSELHGSSSGLSAGPELCAVLAEIEMQGPMHPQLSHITPQLQPLTPLLQVLQGLDPGAWRKVQQVVAEVHSDALLEQVTAALRERFAHVEAEQGDRMRGTQLYMVYATQPRAPH